MMSVDLYNLIFSILQAIRKIGGIFMLLLRVNCLFHLLIITVISTILSSCQTFFEAEQKTHLIIAPLNDKLDVGAVYTYPLFLKMPENLNSQELEEYFQQKCVNISQNIVKNIKDFEGAIDLIKVHRKGKYCIITTYVPPDDEGEAKTMKFD